jgi:hypothetical protein
MSDHDESIIHAAKTVENRFRAAEHVIAEAINPEAGYGNPDDLCWKHARTIAGALERANLLLQPGQLAHETDTYPSVPPCSCGLDDCCLRAAASADPVDGAS